MKDQMLYNNIAGRINRDVFVSQEWTPQTPSSNGYWTFKSLWNPPTSDRNILSVGLYDMACLSLNGNPCVQTTSQILNVTYIIITIVPGVLSLYYKSSKRQREREIDRIAF